MAVRVDGVVMHIFLNLLALLSTISCVPFIFRHLSVTRLPQPMIQSNHSLEEIPDALVAVRDDSNRQSSFMVAIGN